MPGINAPPPVSDAASDNWADRYAPGWALPYLRLMRIDRPVGAWLLLLPCWWGVALSTPRGELPSLRLLLIFAAAAVVMRGAGCTLNDILDADLDARVSRTKSRPIPSGQVSRPRALLFCGAQCVVGTLLITQTNGLTVVLTVCSLLLVAVYPLMKRVMGFPQLVLGLTFNWGIILGFTSVIERTTTATWLLYAGAALWTFGYDTIYAHQDRDDDRALRIGSSALSLGDASRFAVGLSYAAALILFVAAGLAAGLHTNGFVVFVAVASQLARQVISTNLDDPDSCLAAFKSNQRVGLFVFLALVLGRFMPPL